MPRTKQYDRNEVLWKAVALFWEKGFHATSVSDLVDQLGVNRATLYEAFGDKHQLFLEALEAYRKDQGKETSDLGPDFDLHTFLRTFLDDILAHIRGDGGAKGCFIVNSSIDLAQHDEQVRTIVRHNMDDFVNRFSKLFAHAQQLGQLSPHKDPLALAHWLYATLNGMRVLSRTEVNEQVLQDVADHLLHGILD